jgi:hypothetical protein
MIILILPDDYNHLGALLQKIALPWFFIGYWILKRSWISILAPYFFPHFNNCILIKLIAYGVTEVLYV